MQRCAWTRIGADTAVVRERSYSTTHTTAICNMGVTHPQNKRPTTNNFKGDCDHTCFIPESLKLPVRTAN
eukprot:6835218-Prorocentrum_lima.AAC.1